MSEHVLGRPHARLTRYVVAIGVAEQVRMDVRGDVGPFATAMTSVRSAWLDDGLSA